MKKKMSKLIHRLSGRSKDKSKAMKKNGHASVSTLETDHVGPKTNPRYDDIETDSVPDRTEEDHNGGHNDYISDPAIGELIREGTLDSGFASSQRTRLHYQSDLHNQKISCQKYPNHELFIPVKMFSEEHLFDPFKSQDVAQLIKLWGQFIVRLVISFTATDRPESVAISGSFNGPRTGSGTAFLFDMKEKEPCNCKEVEGDHSVSGLFKVLTAAHVVFDNREAQNTVIEFFFDGPDRDEIVRARGETVTVDVDNNRSIIECRTHDLKLYDRLAKAQLQIERLNRAASERPANGQTLAVLISHPHGASKHVSVGNLLEIKAHGSIKETKEGMQLVDCNLSYSTPTCAGAGGGAVNVIRSCTMKSAAFAPHCASKTNGENISGLGWARIMDNWP